MASRVSVGGPPLGTSERLAVFVQNLEFDPPEYRKQIRQLLDDSPQSFLTAAVHVMKNQAETRGAQFVASLLVQSGLLLPALCDPSLSYEDALALARLAMRADSMKDVVLGRASVDRVASSRVIQTLEQNSGGKDFLPLLMRLLRQPNPYLRSKAVLMLGRDTQNVNWIRKILADADPRIRANAVEAIWGLDRPEVRELLRSLTGDTSNRVAGNALLGLYRLGDAETIAEIVEMAEREEPAFRATAAWVMGETGHPRFSEALATLMKDAHPLPRRTARTAVARVSKATAEARELPARRLSARVLPQVRHEETRRVSLAVAEIPGGPAAPILATHIFLTEDDMPIYSYQLSAPPVDERSLVVFVLPSSEAGGSSNWSGYALQCLNRKRLFDAWSCVSYASGVLESGNTAATETGLRFHSEESEIREDLEMAPQQPTRRDVWHAIWRAIEPEPGSTANSRNLIVCNDSQSDCVPGAGLVSSLRASGSQLQVVSSVPNRALQDLCQQVHGSFLLGRTAAAQAALLEQAYLNLRAQYEVAYEPALANPKVLKVSLFHPSGWGETSITMRPLTT